MDDPPVQWYIQWVYWAPLCITISISDQKIMSGCLFKIHNYFFSEFFKKKIYFILCKFLVQMLQCEKKNNNFLSVKTWKNRSKK